MQNRKIILVVILVLTVITAGFLLYNRGSKHKNLKKVKVSLGWVHQAQFAGFYVAKEKGYYKDVGLDVEFLELDPKIDQIDQLKNSDVDFAVFEAHQLLAGMNKGVDIKAVMAIYQINPHSLAVRRDSGIKGPEDFSGKVVGLAGGEGEGNTLFRIFIDRFGKGGQVSYKKLGFNTIEDFMNKEADIIDIYRTDQPYLAEKKGVPLKIISLDAYGLSTYGDILAVNNSTIEGDEKMVSGFVKATQKGWDYALANQNEAVVITLPYTAGVYKEMEYQNYIMQQSAPLIRGVQSDIGRMELVSWSTLYESMRSVGVVDEDLDIRSVYTNKFIR